MLDRIVRAIRLEPAFYRQVADNPAFTTESAIIAIIAAVLGALGSISNSQNGLFAFILQVGNSLLFGWIGWALIAYFVGTRFFNGRSSPNEMIRVLGYASAPHLLSIFTLIPCVGWIIALAGWLLSLAAGVIAIRESMEFDTTSAVITAIVGLIIYIIIAIVLGITVGILTMPFRM